VKLIRTFLLAAALAVLGTAVFARPAGAVSPLPTFQELEEALTCQCGCGLTVLSCNHLQCDSAGPLRQEIRQQMALGKTKAQILAHFTNKYGEKILSAPTTTGFNLTAWVTPFILVGIGALIVGIAIVRWGRRPPDEPPSGPNAPAPPSEYQKILERELKQFSE
jgi:cytochrome c-type biogenesis protein CcmH